jgi:NADH-quinone oxidoreductase subunit L
MDTLYLAIPLLPLAGAIIAGLFGRRIGRVGAHRVTIGAVALAFALSLIAFWHLVFGGGAVFNDTV